MPGTTFDFFTFSREVPHQLLDDDKFLAGSFSNEAGSRDYKLYVPSVDIAGPLPLLVMLHGCNQQPDDFAQSTGMNLLAEEEPCLVLYPAQSTRANSSGCWNWHQPADQRRDRGEPAIIAGLTRSIAATYPVDPARIYVAGLSAGGAMACIMGATYPDLYAAVGIHSGLPYGAAHDLFSACDAMWHGAHGFHGASAAPVDVQRPVIIFHGDRDTTVHPSNADRIVAQAVAEREEGRDADHIELIEPDSADHDHYTCTRTIRVDRRRQVRVEQWLLHGAGHAWSGGRTHGSFADPKGPDASREMMRFFSELQQDCCCSNCMS